MSEDIVKDSVESRLLHGDTLFGSLLRSRDEAPVGHRALAGPRNVDSWVELTYDGLVSEVEQVSEHLAALGLGRGDVMCLQLPNWTEAVVFTYAASRLGAVVCPVTTIYREREMGFILERTECKIVVVPSNYRGFDFASMVSGLSPTLPSLEHIICVGESTTPGVVPSSGLLLHSGGEIANGETDDVDDVAVLAFTSGTTGESKGVMHSHRSMHAAIDDLVRHAGLKKGMTSLVMSPFGHLTGFTWGVLMPLRTCGDVVLLESWDARRALELVEEYGVSFTMGATHFSATSSTSPRRVRHSQKSSSAGEHQYRPAWCSRLSPGSGVGLSRSGG